MQDDLKFPLPPRERDFLDAAINGNVPRLRELLAEGVPVDVLDNRDYPWGQTALMHAARGGHPEAVRFLLLAGANVSARDKGWGREMEANRQSLHYAMQSKHLAVAEALLDADANPNAVSLFGDTPLNVAIEHDHVDGVRLLLARGADVELKPRNKEYTPPLCAAARAGKSDLLRILLEAGADVHAVSSLNQSPLICAASASDEIAAVVMRDLLKAGANIEHVDDLGTTALSRTVLDRHHRAARVLLETGADPNRYFSKRGETLLDTIERNVQSSHKESKTGSEYSAGLLQSWQEMLDLFREFHAKHASEMK